jgi:hypothetical protein
MMFSLTTVRKTIMELAIYREMAAQDAMGAVEKLGATFARSGILGIDSPAQGEIVAITCLSEGITPLQFKAKYDIIMNNPAVRSQWILAEFRRRGGKIKWMNDGEDGVEAKAEFEHEGQKVTRAYTFVQAKKANLVKPGGSYEKDPGAMLRARLVSRTIKMIAPEILDGFMSEADAEDSEPFRQNTSSDESAFKANDSTAAPKEVTAKVVDDDENKTKAKKGAKKASGKKAAAPKETTPAKEEVPKEEVQKVDATAAEAPFEADAPAETVAPVEEAAVGAYGENTEADAIAYVTHLGWITDGQDMSNLPVIKDDLIKSRPDSFIKSLTIWKAKQNG